ncbi:MAG TPA: alpha/beta fold hydrolase [Candidatus Limnocylindrales bacterium]|nr:alpha/beta fold hydrolase [Candidatus Limnocylindrales bacterium]
MTGTLLQQLTRRPHASLRLFCFPYAGGGISVYRQWDRLPGTVDVWGVQLPGREERLLERPAERMTDIVELICAVLPGALDRPYAFFGHSMGAIVSWEVARRLTDGGASPPVRFFISGCRAPYLREETNTHLLPEDELIAELRRMEGTPEAVLANKDLMPLVLPTIRADFAVLETYEFKSPGPVDIPITVLGGTDDAGILLEHLNGWGELTRGGCDVHLLPGGHLFLREQRDAVLGLIEERLAPAIAPAGPR